MRFFALEKLINLHEGYTAHFRIDHLQLLLFQREGELRLVEATCPHRGHSLGVADIHDGVIRCAQHGYQFAVDDGRLLLATEESCRGLRTFAIVYEGNEVGILLDDEP